MTRLRIEQDGVDHRFVDVSPDVALVLRFREPFAPEMSELAFSLHELVTIEVVDRPVAVPPQGPGFMRDGVLHSPDGVAVAEAAPRKGRGR